MQYRMCYFMIFSILILFLLTGCSFDDNGSIDVEMGIIDVNVLSISDDRPAEVVIGVEGINSNTCGGSANVYYERDGDTIRVWATKSVYKGFEPCGEAITDVYGTVTVGQLAVGEYKIMIDDQERIRFRVEDDAGYVLRKPFVENVSFVLKKTDGSELIDSHVDIDEMVQVLMTFTGYFDSKCVPVFTALMPKDKKVGIQSDSYGVMHDIFAIDVYGEVQITSGCLSLVGPSQKEYGHYYWGMPYTTTVALGMFSYGDYIFSVNGEIASFSIKTQM